MMIGKPWKHRNCAIWNKFSTLGIINGTWPPRSIEIRDGFQFLRSDGGGRRVNAAVLFDAHTNWQTNCPDVPLFQTWPEDDEFDDYLEAKGYRAEDESLVLVLDERTHALSFEPSHLEAFHAPSKDMIAFWNANHVENDRIAVMKRAAAPHFIIQKQGDTIIGAGFLGLYDEYAMLHSLVIDKTYRRQGCALQFVDYCMAFAKEQGATCFSTIVVADNHAARQLYERFNSQIVTHYKYRVKPL